MAFAFTASTLSNLVPLSSDLTLRNKNRGLGRASMASDAVFLKERLHKQGRMGWRIVLVKYPGLLFHRSGLFLLTRSRRVSELRYNNVG